ncbi:MAG: adenylate/guanylate cyclase domain-containing protein [Xanthobacteraceae bacterium]|nr:adenylate/guanylate cyclase domain-containing protein [Xanthobacteraceae bacterium]MBV9629826.1 adenylate/guanylate cyclase domain-containing protein [Xanthobacteraceae bacterium]
MRARTQQAVRIVVGITIASAVFGATVSSFTPDGARVGIFTGAVIGFVLSTLGSLMLGPWSRALQHWPMGVVFLLRTLIYGIVFMLVPNAISALVHGSFAPFRDPTRVVTGTTLALSFAFAFCINFALTVTRLLGPRTMMSFVTGRYYRPREERRIVLFADLIGSTKLGEQLGDQKFHAFLNQVFWDMTEPVLEAGGEIDRYIGDELVVSWVLPDRASTADERRTAAIACIFAIEDALAARAEHYRTRFGTVPRFRAALHAGPLVVGEMGDVKREIVLLGDTMNTTARIESACRTTGYDYIASAPAMPELGALPADVHAEKLGPVELRGKLQVVELFGLKRVTS